MGPHQLGPKEIDGKAYTCTLLAILLLVKRSGLTLTRKRDLIPTIHSYKPYWLSWEVTFEVLFGHPILGTSPIKWSQSPDMVKTVDRDVKHHFKQTKNSHIIVS